MDPAATRISAMRFQTLALTTLISAATLADELPVDRLPERDGTVVGEIRLEKSNVFNLADPAENNWLYRLANRLHIVTKDKVIRKQLLLRSGDDYSTRLADESERILRGNAYLFDATIKPVKGANGVVDLTVHTRDVWTLNPDISLSRSGGENRTKIGLEDTNLLGRGRLIRVARIKDVDRTEKSFEFADRHLGRSWVEASLKIADNSDGKLNWLSARRPFYALDTRWSAGTTLFENEKREALYRFGDEAAEYQHERDYVSAFAGWSKGLQKGWVRRWTTGAVFDDNRFSVVPSPELPALLPENRKLVYPFIGVDILKDDYQTSTNRDQIGKTEDFYLGTRLSASLGWASESFGADRDALIIAARASRGFGALQKDALLLAASVDGRLESGDTRNTQFTVSARYYKTQSANRLLFMTLSATAGHKLDRDNPVQIGGDTGLRGYPLRYRSGDSKLLFTIEQRFFTDWYPFRLVRIGGAIFADTGCVSGKNPVGPERSGWLTDVGFGLRFAPTRSSAGKMIHLDIAFPLDGDASIDSVQILLESKRGF
jgi:outer membrane protein assembly factor BamA